MYNTNVGHVHKQALDRINDTTTGPGNKLEDHCFDCVNGKHPRSSVSKVYSGSQHKKLTMFLNFMGPFKPGYKDITKNIMALRGNRYGSVFPIRFKTKWLNSLVLLDIRIYKQCRQVLILSSLVPSFRSSLMLEVLFIVLLHHTDMR